MDDNLSREWKKGKPLTADALHHQHSQYYQSFPQPNMYTRRTVNVCDNVDDDDIVILPPPVKQPPLVIDIDSDVEDDYRNMFKSQYHTKTEPTSGSGSKQRNAVTYRQVAHSQTRQEQSSSSTTTIWTDNKIRFINTVNGGTSIIKKEEFAPITISKSIFCDDDDEPGNEFVPVERQNSTPLFTPQQSSIWMTGSQIPRSNLYETDTHKTDPIILIPRSTSPYRSFTPNVTTSTASSSQGHPQQCAPNDDNNSSPDWQQQVRRVNFNTLEPASYGFSPPTWNPTNSAFQSYNMYNTPSRNLQEMQPPPSFTEGRPKQRRIQNDKCTIKIHLTRPELNVLLPEMDKKGGMILELADRFKVDIFLSLKDNLIVIEKGADTGRELVMNQILNWLPYQLSRCDNRSTRFSPPETMQQFQNWQQTSVQQSTRSESETKPFTEDQGGVHNYPGFIPTRVYSVPRNLNTKQSWRSGSKRKGSKLILPSHTGKSCLPKNKHGHKKKKFKHHPNHLKKIKQQSLHGLGFHPPQGQRNGGGRNGIQFVRCTNPIDRRMGQAKIKSEK